MIRFACGFHVGLKFAVFPHCSHFDVCFDVCNVGKLVIYVTIKVVAFSDTFVVLVAAVLVVIVVVFVISFVALVATVVAILVAAIVTIVVFIGL